MGLLGKLLSRGQTAARYPFALLPFLASCSADDCEDPLSTVMLDPSLENESLTLKIREQAQKEAGSLVTARIAMPAAITLLWISFMRKRNRPLSRLNHLLGYFASGR